MRANTTRLRQTRRRTGPQASAASNNVQSAALRRTRAYQLRPEGTVIDPLDENRPVRQQDPLLARLRSGDTSAFRTLVQRHHPSMVGIAQRIVHNRATAEEIAQDTWVAVVEELSAFEGRSSLKNWIFAILLNKARSRVTRDQRIQTVGSFGDLTDDDPVGLEAMRFDAEAQWQDDPQLRDEITPERIVAGRHLLSHVRKAIDSLPETQRSLLVGRGVDGIDAAASRSGLGISEGNARVLLHRARARLRQVARQVTGEPLARSVIPQGKPAICDAPI